MNSELFNLYLFAQMLAKVALLTGFAPGIAVIAIYKRVSGDGQLAISKRLDSSGGFNPATSPSRKIKTWRTA
jgi:hypothetical protein